MKPTAIAVTVGAVLVAHQVYACGGFFCNQLPVDQTGEQIVFAMGDGEVSATIRINYQGSAADFAWVVPLPAEPSAPEVGSDDIFNALSARLQPTFYTSWNSQNACEQDIWGYGEKEYAAADSAEGEGDGGGGVDVSFRGNVGPYDAAIIHSEEADVLRTWLTDNGYDVPDAAAALIDPYVKQGDWFVALKLLSDSDVGDIQPITLRFAFDRPCVPLRLTAIAALANMDVRLWVLGDARAIPTNYRHVLIDEAKIDWMCGAYNYQDVVTEAANESGGQAFVTEYAGESSIMAGSLYWKGRFNVEALALRTDPRDFLSEIFFTQFFPASEALLEVLLDHIPPPKGWEATNFYNVVLDDQSLWAYLDSLEFDSVAAAADLDTRVVRPLADAQALLDSKPYLTQLFTTISPEEMTLDPMFSFNSDLPDVSNVHSATVSMQCGDGGNYYQLQLADGREIWMGPEGWDCATADAKAEVGTVKRLMADLPGSEKVEDLPEGTGAAKPVYSNSAQIDRILARHNAVVRGQAGIGDGWWGCSVGSGKGDLPMAWVMLGVALLFRRRALLRSHRPSQESDKTGVAD